jgi:hypothetical protein
LEKRKVARKGTPIVVALDGKVHTAVTVYSQRYARESQLLNGGGGTIVPTQDSEVTTERRIPN